MIYHPDGPPFLNLTFDILFGIVSTNLLLSSIKIIFSQISCILVVGGNKPRPCRVGVFLEGSEDANAHTPSANRYMSLSCCFMLLLKGDIPNTRELEDIYISEVKAASFTCVAKSVWSCYRVGVYLS